MDDDPQPLIDITSPAPRPPAAQDDADRTDRELYQQARRRALDDPLERYRREMEAHDRVWRELKLTPTGRPPFADGTGD
jgi:hypothetical protein